MMKPGHLLIAAALVVAPVTVQAANCTDGTNSYTAIERVNPNVVYAENGGTAIIAVCSMDMAVEATDPGGAEYPARDFAAGLNPNNAQYDLTELASLMRSMGLAAQTTPFSSKGCVCATN
ncbi:hypothetical protein [Maritimibacter sp. DP1N21-5]|uniref:hypothetical protein n=1 Tax=Maritimibacter sp. DP1N21-5 TaxID=2836867 RepID=UPI001C46F794|nr:hypothetical protein [Maritimibacter sp. DP1N21-5]MBV7409461.1 hypothetical protein [Maritimibacter sp. DP1N21-5]